MVAEPICVEGGPAGDGADLFGRPEVHGNLMSLLEASESGKDRGNNPLEDYRLLFNFDLQILQDGKSAAEASQQQLQALRTQAEAAVKAGKSDAEIRDHLVARYGDFILFRPQFAWRNAWLWGAPVLLMLVGVYVAVRVVRGRAALAHGPDDTRDEDPPA